MEPGRADTVERGGPVRVGPVRVGPLIPAPPLGPRYWAVLCSASVLGANLGDVLSRELGLGYWRGLPVLAVLFGCVALVARFAPRTTAWYWLAIVLVRAAATNLSDLQILTPGEPPAVRSPWSFPVVIAAWAVALALLAYRDRGAGDDAPRGGGGDPWFWATMLVAGTLGTAVGDWLAFRSGLELPGAVALSTAVLAAALLTVSGAARRRGIVFWIVVACVRTWGTNVGDFLSDTVGLVQVTAAVAALTVLLLYFWRPGRPRDAVAAGDRKDRA